jgi:hypothetical protein
MKKAITVCSFAILLTFSGCDKYGVGTKLDRMVGNWVPVTLPEGCVVKQIASDETGIAVLCDDGRIFH